MNTKKKDNGALIRLNIHNILYEIYKSNLNLESRSLKKYYNNFDDRDKSFIKNVCLNTMRYYFHTSLIIKKYLKKKTNIHENLLLSSAITQIVYLEFRDYAVINSSVEVAKKLNLYAGLINASLKNINKNKEKLKKLKLSIKDLPNWFQKNTKHILKKEIEKLLNTFFEQGSLHIVFKGEKELLDFEKKLIKTSNKSGFIIDRKNIFDLKSFNEGNWWVQDFSSSFPLMYLSEKEIHGNSIDFCSAPGGKAFQVLSNKIKITLNDINKVRIKKLKENLKRLKFNANILSENALNLSEKNKYDFIIIDSPCSAVGTLRKNPEILFKKKQPNLYNLNVLQESLINKASILLKEKGVILYMVCSFLENETTDQINKFLEKNKNFKILNIYENKIYLKYHKLIKNNYMHTLPTSINGFNIDGYFAIYLKKI